MMTSEETSAVAGKAIEFITQHAILRSGVPDDLGRICAAMSAMMIVALADSKPDVAREFTQAFMQDVETMVSHLVKDAAAGAPAP